MEPDDRRKKKFDQSHVDLLLESVEKWNGQAKKFGFVARLEGANLRKVNLKGANLDKAHLGGAYLFGANLEGASLQKANLEGADLTGARLEGANLYTADLKGANLRDAHLKGAALKMASLEGANLTTANLEGANLWGADLEGACLRGTSLSDADLRRVHAVRLDGTFVRSARFSDRPDDPWSILRNAYTGPKLLFIICLLIAFAVPYVAKLGFWHSVNAGQGHTLALLESVRQRGIDAGLDSKQIDALELSDRDLASYSLCLTNACESRPAWRVVLGIDQGIAFWLPAVVLIVYNLLRALITYLVAPMRDAEERSGYSPAWKGKPWEAYGFLYHVHRVAYVLGILALIAFAWNAQLWLRQPVWVPAMQPTIATSVESAA